MSRIGFINPNQTKMQRTLKVLRLALPIVFFIAFFQSQLIFASSQRNLTIGSHNLHGF